MAELCDRLHIDLRRRVDDSYDIIFGEHLFPEIAQYLKTNPIGDRYAIITDTNVAPLHAPALEQALKDERIPYVTLEFPAGERYKRIETCIDLIGELSRLKFDRDAAIVALGGGVVGDMAGFVASIYQRGIPFAQIPTTVLAQADAAVGGKTGVDTPYGKNLIGTFQQPKRVYVDIATLMTLPAHEYENGLAETIKHGIIYDADFFQYLERHMSLLLQRDRDAYLYVAQKNCSIKGEIVAKDPYEHSMRRILNYGHTVGHAIELLSDFQFPHGQCVSIGMIVAGRISHALGYFPAEQLARQERVLQSARLPTTLPEQISDEAILEVTTRDKKAERGNARYCLPTCPGSMCSFDGTYAKHVDECVVLAALRATR